MTDDVYPQCTGDKNGMHQGSASTPAWNSDCEARRKMNVIDMTIGFCCAELNFVENRPLRLCLRLFDFAMVATAFAYSTLWMFSGSLDLSSITIFPVTCYQIAASVVASRWVSSQADMLRNVGSSVRNTTRTTINRVAAVHGVIWIIYALDIVTFFAEFPLVTMCFELQFLTFVVGRTMASCFLICVMLIDLSHDLDHVTSNYAGPSAANAVERHRYCVRKINHINASLGNTLDWIISSGSLVVSTAQTMALISSCPLVRYAIVSTLSNLGPLTIMVIFAEKVARSMSYARKTLRHCGLGDDACGITEGLFNGNALGIRWLAKSGVMGFSTALPGLATVASYASLICSTPLFEKNDAFSFFCET